MKRTLTIIAIIVGVILISWLIFLLKVRAQQACHESAYWKAYDETTDLKIDQKERAALEKKLYDQYYNECKTRK